MSRIGTGLIVIGHLVCMVGCNLRGGHVHDELPASKNYCLICCRWVRKHDWLEQPAR